MALFSYLKPFAFQVVSRSRVAVETVQSGVTQIELKDGRSVRVSLIVKAVRESTRDPTLVDVDYEVVAEIDPPKTFISPEHKTYH